MFGFAINPRLAQNRKLPIFTPYGQMHSKLSLSIPGACPRTWRAVAHIRLQGLGDQVGDPAYKALIEEYLIDFNGT